jgi:hypothetical protein
MYGYGAFSEAFVVEASDKPGRPNIPTVMLSNTNVVIEWVAPADHSSQIDAYQVLFK